VPLTFRSDFGVNRMLTTKSIVLGVFAQQGTAWTRADPRDFGREALFTFTSA